MSVVRVLALLALLLCSGCIAQVPYSPNTTLLESLERGQVEQELYDLLTSRTQSPQIFQVELNSAGFTYRYAGGVYVGWGATYQGEGVVRILYDEVARIDLYENNKAFLYNAAGARLGHEFLFTALDDCRRFADYLASFRYAGQRREAAERRAGPPAGQDPAPRAEGAPR